MNKPPTLNARAAEIGASVVTLRSWQRCGVDVFSDDDVTAHLRTVRKLPPNLKPGFRPQTQDAALVVDVDSIDIDQLKLDMVNAPDKHTAQTIQIKIQGLIASTKLAEAQGDLVPKKYVDESLVRIGSATKAAAMRLPADLPPMLHGATMEDAQRLITDKVLEFLGLLADQSADIWEGLKDD